MDFEQRTWLKFAQVSYHGTLLPEYLLAHGGGEKLTSKKKKKLLLGYGQRVYYPIFLEID